MVTFEVYDTLLKKKKILLFQNSKEPQCIHLLKQNNIANRSTGNISILPTKKSP
jgi:hypothetical protein